MINSPEKLLTVKEVVDFLDEANRQERIGPEEITKLARLFNVTFNLRSNSTEFRQLVKALTARFSERHALTVWTQSQIEDCIKPSTYRALVEDLTEGWGTPPQTPDQWDPE